MAELKSASRPRIHARLRASDPCQHPRFARSDPMAQCSVVRPPNRPLRPNDVTPEPDRLSIDGVAGGQQARR